MTGFYGAPTALGGITIERKDYGCRRLHEWRVGFEEPKDMSAALLIPEDAKLRRFRVD